MQFAAGLGIQALKIVQNECVSPEGYFLASAPRNEESGTGIYDYFFARDSMIMSLFALELYRLTGDTSLLPVVRRSIEKCSDTQGMEVNVYNGELPGRIIHWIRPSDPNYKRNPDEKEWYKHPSGIMRIFMSADSTALYLLTLAKYSEVMAGNAKAEAWVRSQEGHAAAALRFLLHHGDTNNDGLQDYTYEGRSGGYAEDWGGHPYQGWKDSGKLYGGDILPYPHTLCEVQGYSYAAFRKWARYFGSAKRKYDDGSMAEQLAHAANRLKGEFNRRFPVTDENGWYIPAILYGGGKHTMHVESNMGHLLFECDDNPTTGEPDSILDTDTARKVRDRLMEPNMFVPQGGIRTLASCDSCFDQEKYHEGAIWPHDSMVSALGLHSHGFRNDALKIMNAIVIGNAHFAEQGKAPGMELYGYDAATGEYPTFRHANGNEANDKQGWALLAVAVAEQYLKAA